MKSESQVMKTSHLSRIYARYRWLSAILVWIVAGVLSWRFVAILYPHASNTPYMDDWDQPIFEANRQTGWLALFAHQHSSIRTGMGLVAAKLVLECSDYNLYATTLLCLLLVVAAAAIFLIAKQVAWGKLEITDVALPLLCLMPATWECLLLYTMMDVHAMPLFLVSFYLLAWLLPNKAARLVCVLVLNLLTVYSGFGLFIGMVTPILFAGEWLRNRRDRQSIIGMAVSLLTLEIYFYGLKMMPALSATWGQRIQFMALAAAHFWGVQDSPAPITIIKGHYIPDGTTVRFGVFILCILLIVCGYAASRWLRSGDKAARLVFSATAFTLLELAVNAYGRAGMGPYSALSSRYLLLLIPGMCGLYLAMFWLPGSYSLVARTAIVLLALWGCFPVSNGDASEMAHIGESRDAWGAAYRQTGDIGVASQVARFAIYPKEQMEDSRTSRKLAWLRQERLSFFR